MPWCRCFGGITNGVQGKGGGGIKTHRTGDGGGVGAKHVPYDETLGSCDNFHAVVARERRGVEGGFYVVAREGEGHHETSTRGGVRSAPMTPRYVGVWGGGFEGVDGV